MVTVEADMPEPTEVIEKDLLPWLRDREANCLRLAKLKVGEDRQGWLEDAAYFKLAVVALEKKLDELAAFKFWNDVQQITAKHGCLGGDNVLEWLDDRLGVASVVVEPKWPN